MTIASVRTDHALVDARSRGRLATDAVAAARVGAGLVLAAWLARHVPGGSCLSHPAWLLPAALWVIVPHRASSLRRLQDLVFLYISLAMVTEAARVSWEISAGPLGLRSQRKPGVRGPGWRG